MPNGLALQLPEKVDAAVACYSLGVLDIDQLEKGIEAIWRNLRPDGKVLIVETHIPEAKSMVEKIYHFTLRAILLRLFEDRYSRVMLPSIERYFETIEIEYVPRMHALAFLGKRRDIVLPGAHAEVTKCDTAKASGSH